MLGCIVRFVVRSFVVLSRGALPRFRYDLLIGIMWKYILPVVVAYLRVVVILV